MLRPSPAVGLRCCNFLENFSSVICSSLCNFWIAQRGLHPFRATVWSLPSVAEVRCLLHDVPPRLSCIKRFTTRMACALVSRIVLRANPAALPAPRREPCRSKLPPPQRRRVLKSPGFTLTCMRSALKNTGAGSSRPSLRPAAVGHPGIASCHIHVPTAASLCHNGGCAGKGHRSRHAGSSNTQGG